LGVDSRPDILVLGGGGLAGVHWLNGVLAGLEDRLGFALADCEYFVGTSAGSLVAARLAAGHALPRPTAAQTDSSSVTEAIADADRARPAHPLASGVLTHATNTVSRWAMALSAPAASIGLRLGAAPGAVARAVALRLMPPGVSSLGLLEDVEGEWDGRLRVVAVERRSGKRVVFGAPGAPAASVAEAVHASCAVPWLFAPAVIGDTEYVDGGVWSPTSLDIAPAARGTRVLCLCPTGSLYGAFPLPLRLASRATALTEASVLIGRGAQVRLLTPDRSAADAMGRDLMADQPAAPTLAAGYRQGLAAADGDRLGLTWAA